jgi:tetratricopeptide (TPR) repeat protein
MRVRWAIWAFALTLAAGGVSQAFDTVKTVKMNMSGHIVGMTAEQVDLQQPGATGVVKEFPANQIQTIYYDEDPKELKAAKDSVIKGHYADALAALGRIKKDPDRKEAVQDIEFYKALCAAKLALAGSGKVADAQRMMKAFADANATSYHYFETMESMGDLLLAMHQYTQAIGYYGRLAKSPWRPEYPMRAGVATGHALLAQGNADDALAAFEKVIATETSAEIAQPQRLAATLGKARVLLAQQKPDEAIQLAEGVLKAVPPADESLRAQAYNIEGTAHRRAGRTQDALFAFLHVELTYSAVPSAHAEALANLADLWEQVHKAERANTARKTLEERYKDSPWAKKVGQ